MYMYGADYSSKPTGAWLLWQCWLLYTDAGEGVLGTQRPVSAQTGKRWPTQAGTGTQTGKQ